MPALHVIPGSTTAGLPSGVAGAAARLTDGGASGALVLHDGTNWTCEAAKSQKLFIVTCPPYNAKGDGTTDDTAALQAAVDAASAAGGGLVFAPNGTYIQTAGILWKSKVSLKGAGIGKTILKMTGAAGQAGYASIVNITDGSTTTPIEDCAFEDFEIDGSALTGSTFHVQNKGIFIEFMERAVFRNLYIHDTPATGLGVDYLVDTVIDSVVVEGNGRLGTTTGSSGIGIGSGQFAIESVVVSNVHALNNKNFGIFFERQTGTGGSNQRFAQVTNVVARGNRSGIGDYGQEWMLVSNSLLYNNTDHGFENAKSPQFATWRGKQGGLFNNQIHSNGKHGVFLELLNPVDADRLGQVVKGNIISDNGQSGIYVTAGAAGLAATSHVALVNNDVFDNDETGIRVVGPGAITDLQIAGNRVWNNGQDTLAASRDGITIETNVTGLTILDNMVFDTQGTPTQQTGLTLGAVTLTRGVIHRNDLRGNASAALTTSATLSSVVILGNEGTTTAEGQLAIARGSAAAPALVFAENPDTGFFGHSNLDRFFVSVNGTAMAQFGKTNDVTAFVLGTNTGTLAIGANGDTVLARDAADIFAQKRTTNPQTFRVYGNTTGSHYLSLAHNGTDGVISVNGGGALSLTSPTLSGTVAGTPTWASLQTFPDATITGSTKISVVATGSLPAAGAGQDGRILIEDNGAGDRNIVIYAGGERFRIDGGVAF